MWDQAGTVASQVSRLLAAARDGRSHGGDGFAFAVSGTDAADLNLLIVWGAAATAGAGAGSALQAWSGPMVALGVGPGEATVAGLAEPAGLGDVGARLPVWACPVPEAVGPIGDLHVGEVRLAEQLADVQEVLAASFGLDASTVAAAFPASNLAVPGLRWFLGVADGEPVACVAALSDGAEGSLWCGGTIPSARGHGYFTALLAGAMRTAGAGVVQRWWGITEAEASARALKRLGATQVLDVRVWVRGSAVGELIAPAG